MARFIHSELRQLRAGRPQPPRHSCSVPPHSNRERSHTIHCGHVAEIVTPPPHTQHHFGGGVICLGGSARPIVGATSGKRSPVASGLLRCACVIGLRGFPKIRKRPSAESKDSRKGVNVCMRDPFIAQT